ncbi:MAG: stage II sporulation protein M [Chloroflexota bacterium]
MFPDIRPALVISRREVRDQFRDWRIIIPILLLTLFFPALMNFTAHKIVGFVERYGAPLIGDRLIPFLLMVVGFFPISVTLVIALESFVGEKERLSIEPLLASPLEDWQLYLGKLIAATTPPLIASYMGIGVYLVGVYRQVGWVPEWMLLMQIIALTTSQALMMVSGAVVVSSQTTSVRAANLLASFIIIPVAFLIQWESMVMFWGQYDILWWTIFGILIVTGLLVRMGVAHFNREELLGREMDALNLRWSWKVFLRHFLGESRSVSGWYRHQVLPSLRNLKLPLVLMAFLLVGAVFIGMDQAKYFVIPSEALRLERLHEGLLTLQLDLRLFATEGIVLVWLVNLRAVLIASLVGFFSFGVVGVVLMMIPLMMVGYFMANLALAGIPPLTFLAAFVLPHGILEIPAAVLVGAAIMRLGAQFVTPGRQYTIGEIWLRSLADCMKITVGLAFPILLASAILEVILTPRIALLLLQP